MINMFGVEELDNHVLLYLDVKTLKNIYFLNKFINNILNNEQFWHDKFCYDRLSVLDSPPSFREYTKILNCKDDAGKILLLNNVEYNSGVKGCTDGHIVITFDNDIKVLAKLSPENEDKIQSFLEDQTNFEIYFVMKPVHNYKDCDSICLVIFSDSPDISCRPFVRSYSFADILSLLIKALYYQCKIKDGTTDNSREFLSEKSIDGSSFYYHRREILSGLNFSDKEILQFQLNRLKEHINKK